MKRTTILFLCLTPLLCSSIEHKQYIASPGAPSSETRNSQVTHKLFLSEPIDFLEHNALATQYSASSVVLEKLQVLSHNEEFRENFGDSKDIEYLSKDYGVRIKGGDASRAKSKVNPRVQNSDDDDNYRYKKKSKILKTAANVLILHPIYAGSHEVVLRGLAVELVKRGHQVTQLRWKSDNTAIDARKHNLSFNTNNSINQDGNITANEYGRHVNILTVSADNRDLRYPYMSRDGSLQPPTRLLWDTDRNILNVPTDVFGLVDAHCSTLLGDSALLAALNASQFTVAVVDLIANECSLAVAHRLNIPVVGYWGFPFQGGEARRMGVNQLPSVVPAMMSEMGPDMSLWQRLYNTVLVVLDELLVTYHTSVTDYWIKLLQPGSPTSDKLLRGVDAMLVSVSWYLDYPRLLPPHIHYIGCLTCRPGKQLDKDLQRWMNSSGTDGVIVFSFGLTGFDSSVVPKKFREGALMALSKITQKVVLHFDPEKLDYIPHNVLARPNIPQQDLLSDPRTRLFVSHCGMNSVNEAVYHGVPLICVPNFADQGDISRRVADRGLGVVLAKGDLTQDTLTQNIREVLGNSKYRDNSARVSEMWQDDKSGEDIAIDWIVKVHQYGPLHHTRPVGLDLSYVQYFCLDVMAIIVVIIFMWLTLVYVLLRSCINLAKKSMLYNNKLKIQ